MKIAETNFLVRWLTVIFVGLFLFILQGCGGGTEGTGVVDVNNGGAAAEGEQGICGVVTDPRGRGLEKILIQSVSTGNLVVSDASGSFSVNVLPDISGQAEITFLSDGEEESAVSVIVNVFQPTVYVLALLQIQIGACGE